MVRTPDNDLFEEAYFVLKPGEGEDPPGKLSEEAARMLAGGRTESERSTRFLRNQWTWFALGIVAGAVLTGLAALLCALL